MRVQQATVRLVFRGEVIDGFLREAVMRDVGAALRVEGERLAHLFSGAPVVLRGALDAAVAERHAQQLAALGAHVHIEAEEPAPVSGSVAAVPTAAAPVTAQITCPNCGEVQPERVLCRACATDMPRALAARREDDERARAQRRAEFRARRGLAPAADGGPGGIAAPSVWGLGWQGRVGRRAYAGVSLCLLAALVGAATWMLNAMSLAKLAVFGAVLLALTVFSLRLAVLRLHDCNRSGWWSLLLLVPWLGLAAGALLMLWPGHREANDHGAPPRAGGGLLVAGGMLALGLAIALGWRTMLALGVNGRPDWGALQATHPPVPAERAAAPTGAERLPNAEARAGFERDYTPAGEHKAFSVSAGGSWGWVSGSNSPETAMWDATVNCEAHRKPGAPRCVPVNVNGTWIDAPAR